MNLKSLLQNEYQEDMTLEQINQALSNKEYIDKQELSMYVKKKIYDRAASDCAKWKKAYHAKAKELDLVLSKQTQERKEQEAKYQALHKQATITKYENHYLVLGYDEPLAKASSIALYNGDMQTVFDNQNKFVMSLKNKTGKEV